MILSVAIWAESKEIVHWLGAIGIHPDPVEESHNRRLSEEKTVVDWETVITKPTTIMQG
jgi:hypothetical protein